MNALELEQRVVEVGDIMGCCLADGNGGPPDPDARDAAEKITELLDRLEQLDPSAVVRHGDLREKADIVTTAARRKADIVTTAVRESDGDEPLEARVQRIAEMTGADPADVRDQLGKTRPIVDGGTIIEDPLAHARDKLDLPELKGVIKRGQDGSIYDLILKGGAVIPVGPFNALSDPRKLEAAIADRLGRYRHLGSRAKFAPTVACLLAIAEVEEGVTPDEVTSSWIDPYLNDRLETTRAEAVHGGEPYREPDGPLHLPLTGLHRYITGVLRLRIEERDLAARLRRLGYRRVVREATKQDDRERGERVRHAYYVAPYVAPDES